MTIKPIKEVKKKRSVKVSQNESEAAEDRFEENNEDVEIEQKILNDVVFPYHYKAKRSVLKKTSGNKGSGANSPRSQVKLNSLNNEEAFGNVTNEINENTSGAPEENVEECSGYNSGDEHAPSEVAIDWKKRDEDFEKLLKTKGFALRNVAEDGACLFRAISTQIYGDENMHDIVRQLTMDYIQKNRDYFSAFVTEDIDEYIKRKRDVRAHGNHIELHAISEVYNRPIELYSYEANPTNIFNSDQIKNGYPPLRLSYQRNNHYNAIIDPYDATVGIGLGLPGLKPTLQTKDAIKLSEDLEIEKTMLEDKLKTADWDATNEAIEEQIARESYIEWLQQTLKKNKKHENTPTATVTSFSAKDNLNSSYNSHNGALDLGPSTSQAKLATEKSTGDEIFGTSEDLNASEKKSVKSKYICNANLDSCDTKRICNFDLRNSKKDLVSGEAAAELNTNNDADHLPSTSKQTSSNSSAKESPQKASNLYEELLQASLAFGEYNESEMFQRVLQMSTEDYLLQKNKSPNPM